MKSYTDLNTEAQNSKTLDIHKLSTINILKKINDEDNKIAIAVRKSIPEIKQVTKMAIKSVKSGGRIFYIGAGTSGRLGVLDASEIPPTYSASKNTFVGIIAGGDKALRNSIEGAETVYLITNPNPYKLTKVDVIIKANTGAEVVTGSTRMKAGTATKMILNMISTTTMIKLGKVYRNLMVDLMAVNDKLIDRGVRIISKITDLNYEDSKSKLYEANKSVKAAIVMIKLECDLEKANQKLNELNGVLSDIID